MGLFLVLAHYSTPRTNNDTWHRASAQERWGEQTNNKRRTREPTHSTLCNEIRKL